MTAQQARDASFRLHMAERGLSAARVAAVLVALLMPSGALLDAWTRPEWVGPFLTLRLGASALALALLALTWQPWARRHAFWLGVGPAFAAAGAIQLMVLRLGGHASPYYAGLSLCILGIGLVFTWRWYQTAAVCGAIVLTWLVTPFLAGHPFSLEPFVNNLYFLSLTSVIAVASNAGRGALARREFEARAALARTTGELAVTLERVKELDRAKTTFFTNISHELRTPLTLVLAPLESLLSGGGQALPPEVLRELRLMRRNGQHLLRNINAVLDLARLDARHERLRLEETDVVDLVRSLVESCQALARKRRVTLELQVDGQLPRVPLDREKVECILLNLMCNAIRFTGEGTGREGRVVVHLGLAGVRWRCAIEDNGVGIPEEQLARLFTRFSRGETGPRMGVSGTGIGLALVKELAEFHLGSVTVQSRLGQGSTFSVELPCDGALYPPERLDRRQQRQPVLVDRRNPEQQARLEQLAEELGALNAEDLTPPLPLPDGEEEPDRPLVLVADDNRDMLHFLSRLLASEYRVRTAGDGEAALALALEETPALVISDMMMPRRSGVDLLQGLRRSPRTARVPVILLTAKADLDSKLDHLELGADDYLTKPFNLRELKARARALIEQRRLERELAEKNEYLSKLNFDLVLGKKQVFLETMAAFAAAVEAKDRYTHGHSLRVSLLAEQLARALELSEAECEKVRLAALLHDVGKIGMPETILNKPGRLTPEEIATFRRHPRLGFQILSVVKDLQEVNHAILHHHERWDGQGYPDALGGQRIPLLSRILAVCDTYDAMTSDRCYRKGQAHEVAMAEIARCAGTQFDPVCADAFLRLFELAPPRFPEFPSAFREAAPLPP